MIFNSSKPLTLPPSWVLCALVGDWDRKMGIQNTFPRRDQPEQGRHAPQEPLQFASLYHTVPAQESGIQLWHQQRRLGVRWVPLCQGPPDPGSATSVLCPVLPPRSPNRTRPVTEAMAKGCLELCPERSKGLFQRSTLEQETVSAVP